jgi:hypothetical protein
MLLVGFSLSLVLRRLRLRNASKSKAVESASNDRRVLAHRGISGRVLNVHYTRKWYRLRKSRFATIHRRS